MATHPADSEPAAALSPRKMASEPAADAYVRLHKQFEAPIPPKEEMPEPPKLPGMLLYGRVISSRLNDQTRLGEPMGVRVSPRREHIATNTDDTPSAPPSVSVGEQPA